MFLKQLSLYNFRNHEEASFSFNGEVNCFTGDNGSGKTNVLDAIHYLALCKSYFSSSDSLSIMEGKSFFAIHGMFNINDSDENIYCGLKQGQRKVIKRNNKEYPRIAEHVGLIPVVMIAPIDQELVTGGSEERRKAIDTTVCQCNKSYLESLTSYNRALQHRNILLKNSSGPDMDADSISVWNEQLALHGTRIYEMRNAFTASVAGLFADAYSSITGKKEHASLRYASQLHNDPLDQLLEKYRHRDSMLQYTSAGVHKDDLEFLIDEKPVKRYGSQGQQKSFVIALKLALYQYIKSAKQTSPLLLLDDIFEKLDDSRMNNLLMLAGSRDYGQIFITDTHPGRAEAVFKKFNKEVKEFHFA